MNVGRKGRDPASPREKPTDKRQARSRWPSGVGRVGRQARFVEESAVDDFVHFFPLSDVAAPTCPRRNLCPIPAFSGDTLDVGKKYKSQNKATCIYFESNMRNIT